MTPSNINEHDFKTGSPPSLLTSDLYQIQVTGLIYLALVMLSVLGGRCSALLSWRAVFILLEKGANTLTELVRLGKYRVPVIL